jgi:hypothetical protein
LSNLIRIFFIFSFFLKSRHPKPHLTKFQENRRTIKFSLYFPFTTIVTLNNQFNKIEKVYLNFYSSECNVRHHAFDHICLPNSIITAPDSRKLLYKTVLMSIINIFEKIMFPKRWNIHLWERTTNNILRKWRRLSIKKI